mmetsp:Transcript_44214/g.58684  ORF Transcript_44214/g.58684 Transcript_44214/m.58684 type:complete len:424 (-) Transcript_44214:863-2134(-)
MDFLLHRNDLSLADGRVEGVLHLFLKLVLALPEEDLLLSIDDIDQNITLLLFELGDLVLKLDRLVLHLLQLLLELHLNVEVIVRELLLPLVVLINEVVELVHLEDLVFLGDLQLANCLVVALNFRIDSDLLLVKDGLLSPEIVTFAINLRLLFLTLDKLDLVGDPVFLHVGRLLVDLLDLLLDVVAVVLRRAHELVAVATVLKSGALTVKTIDFESFLLDAEQPILDVLLDLSHVVLLLLQLSDQVIELLLEHFVLSLRVQVIEAHTRDLIGVVLDLHLLVADRLVGDLGLFEKVSRGLLDGLLLTGVRDDIVADRLRLRVQLHDALVQDVILRTHIGHFLLHASRLHLSLLQRVLEHDLLLLELLFLSLELGHARSKELNLLLPLVQLVVQLLRVVLLFSSLVADTTDLRLDLQDLVVTLVD